MAALTDQGFAVTATLPTTIGLGRLVDLIIRDARGLRLRLKPLCEQWLAWKSDTRDLVVLRPGKGEGVAAKVNDIRRHHRFHGAVPKQARPMEWPAPRGAVRTLGLIESLTYVSTGIHSPSKGLHHWMHRFGDRGERGHDANRTQNSSDYAERHMPRIDVDTRGSIYVVRMPSNDYDVQDWIIG